MVYVKYITIWWHYMIFFSVFSFLFRQRLHQGEWQIGIDGGLWWVGGATFEVTFTLCSAKLHFTLLYSNLIYSLSLTMQCMISALPSFTLLSLTLIWSIPSLYLCSVWFLLCQASLYSPLLQSALFPLSMQCMIVSRRHTNSIPINEVSLN